MLFSFQSANAILMESVYLFYFVLKRTIEWKENKENSAGNLKISLKNKHLYSTYLCDIGDSIF